MAVISFEAFKAARDARQDRATFGDDVITEADLSAARARLQTYRERRQRFDRTATYRD